MKNPYEGSEFGGQGVMPNTVFPKGEDALTPGDKLRLQSLTGQETDSQAKVDPGFWQGNNYFNPQEPSHTYRERREVEREAAREDRDRYKETPR